MNQPKPLAPLPSGQRDDNDHDSFEAVDVQRLQAELDQLRQHVQLLAAAEQIAHIGHCEWDYENDCIRSCSDGYARIYGRSVPEVLQAQSSWERVIEEMHPEDRQRYLQSYNALRQQGSHEIEYRILRHDGETRYIYETVSVLFDEDGKAYATLALLQDITERKLYQQELENRNALAEQVETITEIGHYIFNLVSETYDYLSEGFASIHGVSVEEYMSMVHSRSDDVEDLHPEDLERVLEVYDSHKRKGSDINVEYRIYRSDGSIRWIREQGTVVRDSADVIRQSVGVIQDITGQKNVEEELREARDSLEAMVRKRTRKLAATVKRLENEVREREKIAAKLDFLANHDALTGLPSLRLCKDRLNHSLAEARRNSQLSAVMFLDLDGFKSVNDAHGHEVGDQVLISVAERIRGEIRETDTVARIGGDEFIVILSSLPDTAVVERIAWGLTSRITLPIVVDEIEVTVSASIGISLYPNDGDTVDELIRTADEAMYRIKRKGKNAYGFV